MLGVGAVLAVLQQSLGGWEALETDLLESANLTQQAAELSSRVRSATQVVVDAVLHLLDAGVFRYLTCCCTSAEKLLILLAYTGISTQSRVFTS